MKTFFYFLLSLTMLVSCRQEFDVDISGEITAVSRNIGNFDFTSIKLHDDIELYLEFSSDNSVVVETDVNYQKYVIVKVIGNVLHVKRSISANPSEPVYVKIYVYTDKINRITAWRESQVKLVSPMVKDTVNIEMQKNCRIEGEINCSLLKAFVHDNSVLELYGNAKKVDMVLNENSIADCSNLVLNELEVKCDSGSCYCFSYQNNGAE